MRGTLTAFSAKQISAIKLVAGLLLLLVIYISGMNIENPFLPGRLGSWSGLHGFFAYIAASLLIYFSFRSVSSRFNRILAAVFFAIVIMSGLKSVYGNTSDFLFSKPAMRYFHSVFSWILLSFFVIWLYLSRQSKRY